MTALKHPPMNVLIVEDEALLAMELEDLVGECGHHVIGWAPSESEAVSMINQYEPDLAFVDLQLQGGTSGLNVAEKCHGRKTCLVFITANRRLIPADFVGAAGVIEKPYRASSFRQCMAYLSEAICKPPPVLLKPQDFNISPAYQTKWSTRG